MASSEQVVQDLAGRVTKLRLSHPVRLAIDGRTASGKTTFANMLADTIHKLGRPVVRASVDGFHRSRADRHRQGRLSPDGYYEDARDLEAIRRMLLDPLGPGGDRIYITATFDLDRDGPVDEKPQCTPDNSVLIVDGTFLQRPELRNSWDFVIFLDLSAEEAQRRGVERDALVLGGNELASELYLRRYGPAFERYEAECRPAAHADVVIDNREF